MTDPRQSIIGETVLLEQIAALESKIGEENSEDDDSNSDYDSFHSDEVEKPATTTVNEPPKKDWNSKLQSIREDRSDSIISLKESDRAQIIASVRVQ